MATRDEQLFAEWAKQTFEIVRHTQDQVAAQRQKCDTCRKEVDKVLADLDKKIAINTLKIAVVVGGGVLVIAEIVKHWVDK